ncbi:CPBP family intramembrane glutamic endopeptidase [Geminocystis sp. NIES-3709]|uniref:CPBP family intramembrane glutamic endopeptidase n=1 Tax=Geminocystis sp. NIES-3709 TaxID=1617448 RepID=UPI0005FC3E7B|nr:type II CAAX endopeptidase family protein [Geminocystis sp. NIES-3709]BAQ66903.1 abortive infection protein [Geminocystis sp. NIES-3709]
MLNFEGNLLIALLNNSHGMIKIILFLIIWAVIWFPIAIPLARLVKWQIAAPISNTQKLTFIISLYSLVPILTWALVKVEKIPTEKIGLIFQGSLFKSILFGYGLGILSMVFVYGMELWAGWLNLNSHNEKTPSIWVNLPLLLLISLFISSIEELVFRGIFVYFLEVDFSWWWTGIISSVIFALLHLIWEQKNTLPQLPGLFLMGLVLFYARTLNNYSLGLSIGLHGGWVLILACIDTFDLYRYNPDAQSWLIGKKDQPLASIAGLMVLLITTFSISIIF